MSKQPDMSGINDMDRSYDSPGDDSDVYMITNNPVKQEPEWDISNQIQQCSDQLNNNYKVIGEITLNTAESSAVKVEQTEEDDFEESCIEIENIKEEAVAAGTDTLDKETRAIDGNSAVRLREKRKPGEGRYGEFRCDTCSRVFGRKDQLQVHMRIHSGDKPYTCSSCGKKFRTNGNLAEHMTTHNDARPFACQHKNCNYSSKTKGQLKKHEKIHKIESKKQICKVCNKAFISLFFLKKHQPIHEKKPHACKICFKSFTNEVSLVVHQQMHTSDESTDLPPQRMHKDRLTCNVCSMTFSKNRNLEKHMYKHSDIRAFDCPVCNKSFKTKVTLDQHKFRVHVPREKTCCPVCGKMVVTLKSHMDVHKDERRFSCTECDWSFKTAGQLKAHSNAIHRSTRDHICQYCEKAFKSVHHLRRHVKMVHGEIKPFVCEICGKAFSDKWCLGDHWKMSHSNHKDFSCNLCTAQFKKKYLLRNHSIRHHGKKKSDFDVS